MPNKLWTEWEKKYVCDHAHEKTDEEISVYLTKVSGRKITINAVRKVRQAAGLKKRQGRGYCKLLSPCPDKAELRSDKVEEKAEHAESTSGVCETKDENCCSQDCGIEAEAST